MSDHDVLVIGSGPSGVAAAWPLAEAGLSVHLVDGVLPRLARPAPDRPSLSALRQGAPGNLRHLLGERLDGLRDMKGYSPKLRSCADAAFLEGYHDGNAIASVDFQVVGTMAQGGLSNVWGAAASLFDQEDLADWPISLADLLPSYRRVVKRVGVSGSLFDDMAPIHGLDVELEPPLSLPPSSALLLERYDRRGGMPGFLLGRSRNAVLTRPREDRGACLEDMGCMWGCGVGAIYNSADDLAQLRSLPNVTVLSGLMILRLRRDEDGSVIVTGRTALGEERQLRARRVILAAGTLASTRLALDLLQKFDVPVPVLNAPAFAAGLLIPRRLGQPIPAKGFGMAQLAFRLALPGEAGKSVFGLLYDGASMAAPDLAAQMPLSRFGAKSVLRALLPGLLLALVYLPSSYSRSSASLRRSSDGIPSLEIRGGVSTEHKAAVQMAVKRMASHLRRLGAWLLPGSVSVFEPGAEVHYGGTLPMGVATTIHGELIGAPGVTLADGAIFNTLPAKHHTMTMMANADRIGRHLALEAR
ncbi:4Fe-4S ferredoxin [Paramagnetospirillum kuznetsovii]|uniref:4Fe-4S ferredoxin n=1 Tax=Paramagnetospirillum kuznetsovii TaxID=2053833 RepID=A0A364NXQ3_9PROT|nr:FAD-binding protein [Paramagnetospirillum kuznetsovii]RAU21846.1 4Fe-4S ferredoxin [Paramagnetospirillum kuznetsovii]